MYTLAVVNAEGHGQPVAHAVLANFIVLVLCNFKTVSYTHLTLPTILRV